VKNSPILAWHFLPNDSVTRYSRERVDVGTVLKARGKLHLCYNGLHASIHPRDAMRYAPGFLLCRVKLSGGIQSGDDKVCARSREVIAIRNARNIVLLHAAECAERALGTVVKPDARSMAAIQAVRDYCAGKITNGQMAAARASAAYASAAAAAYAAASSAAAAAYAAYAAASSASSASDAASSASSASDAADAAYAASARRDFQQWDRDRFNERVNELFAQEGGAL